MFDALRFLEEKFHSPQRLMQFFRVYGVSAPEPEAVKKWFQREQIPSTWLPVLLTLLELDDGAPVSLAPYLRPGGEL